MSARLRISEDRNRECFILSFSRSRSNVQGKKAWTTTFCKLTKQSVTWFDSNERFAGSPRTQNMSNL